MNTLRSLGIALFAVALFSAAPFAHAQFDGSGDFSGGCCGDSYSTGVDYSYAPDYGSYSSGVDYSYTPDYGSYSTGVDYTTPADYGSYSTGADYFTSPDYYTSGYSTGGYSTGGYSTGGYWTGSTGFAGGGTMGGYMIGGGSGYNSSSVYAPTNTWDNGNTNIYAPTQTNTCTAGNSCNTNIVTTTNNPAPVVINNTPTPPVYYNPPVYNNPTPVCNTCGCIGFPVCPQPQPQPIVYGNPTPYITLSQVPYTGLDLGFWGTIAYWGFLILWCLAAAYLIVVKKVQNRVYLSLKHFLFGTKPTQAEVIAAQTPAVDLQAILAKMDQLAAMVSSGPQFSTPNGAPVARVQEEDTTDEFILAQIHRPMR